MENKPITLPENFSQNFTDTEDDISLCNFLKSGYEHDGLSRRASNSSDKESFEFFTGLDSNLCRNNSFVDQVDEFHEVNEYRKRDYLCLKSASFHKAKDFQLDCEEEGREWNRSSSNRFLTTKHNFPVQRVNITALTDMSSKSRRMMFMFGPVKFKPEMDLSAIRKRRGRLGPVGIPPMPEEKEREMEIGKSSGLRGGKSSCGVGGDGGLLRPLWCRSHLATALAKSFGCGSASSTV